MSGLPRYRSDRQSTSGLDDGGTPEPSFGQPARSERPDADILCWCEKITRADFRNAAWNAPDEQFYDLCRSIGVGTKCTSCLLDAEAVFDEAVRQPAPKHGAAGARRQVARRGAKRIIYDWFDAWSPRVAVPLRGVVPILAGEGVSTIVTVANSVPRALGARSPRFAVRMEVRDEEGRKINAIAKTLAPGERLDHEITPWSGQGGLSTGSCRVLMRALDEGYRGSIRPHFTVRTPHSLSTVHSQGNGRRATSIRTIIRPERETQYLSVVNCEQEAASIQLRATRDGEEIVTRQVSIAPFGATLLELALPNGLRDPSRPIVAELKSNRLVRNHMVVAAGSPPRISLDHV